MTATAPLVRARDLLPKIDGDLAGTPDELLALIKRSVPEDATAPHARPACDYAFWPHPPLWGLKAAGMICAGRYVSPEPGNDASGKNLIVPEYHALRGNGDVVIMFFESWADRMLGGHPAGLEDARFFDSVCKARGWPGAVMFSSADFDATAAQQVAINAYQQAVISVLGLERAGIYGGFWVVKRVLDAGLASFACQTLAWSGATLLWWQQNKVTLPHAIWDGGTLWDQRAHVRQHLAVKVGGVWVDYDEALADDFGQYPRPGATPPPDPDPAYHLAVPQIGHGDQRSDVVRLAQVLANYRNGDPAKTITVDGVFGGNTVAAIKSLQADKSIPADGVIDARTWSILVTGNA